MNISFKKKEVALLEYVAKRYLTGINGTSSAYEMEDVIYSIIKKVDQGIWEFDYELWGDGRLTQPSLEDRNSAKEKLDEEYLDDVWLAQR
jgi:hypothetical protein